MHQKHAPDSQEPQEEIRKPVSNAEINRELTVLRRLFTLAIKNGKLMTRPPIELLPEGPPRSGFFEREDIDAVCAHLPDALQPVVRFAFVTGWRISEVLHLTWDRVDFAGRGDVRLQHGQSKTGEPRRFPMTTELRRLLEEQQKLKKRTEHTTDEIITRVFFRLVAKGRGGEKHPKPIKSFAKAWAHACQAAGCPGRIPHDLRRSAIRTFVRQGISEHVAMALSGHKTASVFRRYDIVSSSDLEAAAQKLDAPAVPNKTGERRVAKVRKFRPR